jgi:exopolyphosphatase/guanosine-5'-triphosphate,3'-diphosphate pyrophosphatase
VNVCEKKIEKVIHQDGIPVPYQESLDASSNNHIDEQTAEKGKQAIKTLLERCKAKAPIDEAYGIATAAFRQAKNGHALLKRIKDELNVSVAIINQEGEALLGLLSVERSQTPNTKKPPVVWDIGGGSQQIITRDANTSLVMLTGSVATETFKKMLIEELHKKDSSQVTTANPIGNAINVQLAFEIAHDILAFPARHATTLFSHLDKKPHVVVGIGAVHDTVIKTIRNGTNSYTKKELMSAIEKYAPLNDGQLMEIAHDTHPKFAGNILSNLILVHAMMDAFNINKVDVQPINASDVLLVDGLGEKYLMERIIPITSPTTP